MQTKGIIFGFGLGMVFLSAIFMLVYRTSEQASPYVSDDDMLARAAELGMVWPAVEDAWQADIEDIIRRTLAEMGMDVDGTVVQEIVEEVEVVAEPLMEEEDGEETEVIAPPVPTTVEVYIALGWGADLVAMLLYEHGVISDVYGFIDFLVRHDRTRNIHQGWFELPVGGSFNTVMQIIAP